MIKLDKRLAAILSEINGDTLADIGCDHGKLSISAIINGKCNKVIAVDISKGSLDKTVQLAEKYKVTDRIDCRLGNGFQVVNEKVDCAVIAGMGGYEIRDILVAKDLNVSCLVICPHQNAKIARLALNDLGFTAIKDYVIEESGKFYPIIVAIKGNIKYLESQLRFGLNNPSSNEYQQMLFTRKKILDNRFLGREIPEGEMLAEYQEIIKCLR